METSGDRFAGLAAAHGEHFFLQYARPLPAGYSLDASYGISATSNNFSKIGPAWQRARSCLDTPVHEASIGPGEGPLACNALCGESLQQVRLQPVWDTTPAISNRSTDSPLRDYTHSVLRPREIGLEASMTF